MWGEGRAPSSRPPSSSPFPIPGSQAQRLVVGSQRSGEVRKSVALTSPFPHQHILLHSQVWLLKDLGLGIWERGLFGFDFIPAPFFFQPFPPPIKS